MKILRGDEVLTFFKRMTDNQKIEFFGFFDIFIVSFGKNGMPFLSMTALPSNPKFEHTVFISISKGYNKFKECCPLRPTTPSIDLRREIGHSESPFEQFGERALSHSLHLLKELSEEDLRMLSILHFKNRVLGVLEEDL
jgi:hypothetical protein